jgi:hypothetical protein
MARDLTHSANEPHDRLTRLANEVLESLSENPEYEPGVRAIVFVNHNGRAGIGIHGYGEDQQAAIIDATTDLIVHLTAMFEAMGKELKIVSIKQGDPRLS